MKDEFMFRQPYESPEERNAPAFQSQTKVEDGMLIERDILVRLRDGIDLHVDVYRPSNTDQAVAPIIAWGPYGKHAPNQPNRYLPGAMDASDLTRNTAFEAPVPEFWTAHGYAVVNVNPRGTWRSQGNATFLSEQEALDYFDVIEWAGTQKWSNGRVGLSGVSYLASSQWRVAELAPPHLAAINPWEGWSDTYREVVRHGGIPDTVFWPFIQKRWGVGMQMVEDLAMQTELHPFFDEFWETKRARLDRIEVPAYVVASWSDQGLHTRGTLEGFKKIRSKEKWLEVHGDKKWRHFYLQSSRQRLKEFFDHFLLGKASSLSTWPRVRYAARCDAKTSLMLKAPDWPLPETHYVQLYLDPRMGRLKRNPPAEHLIASYDSESRSESPDHLCFDYEFSERTVLAGHAAAHLFMSTEQGEDMDVFVGLQKLDTEGNLVGFNFCAQYDDGPLALGWLRASHRELDESCSTPWQPVLHHRRELPLKQGQAELLHIEILPSGTVFEPGERLRFVVQGSEIFKKRAMVQYQHDDTVNCGRHSLHAGSAFSSHLVLPFVPADAVSIAT